MKRKLGRPPIDKAAKRQRLTVILAPDSLAVVRKRQRDLRTNAGRALDTLLVGNAKI